MIRIGDFARISRVTVRTLRYYEEVDLLRPLEVDRWTGYRYYSMEQLPRLNRILALKDLGLSLEQIGQLLGRDVTAEQLRGMLMLRRAELEQQMRDTKEQLARVEARLMQIEMEGEMSTYDVVLKKLEPQRVAVVHGVVPSMEVIGPTFDRLFDQVGEYVCAHKLSFAGPGIALYYNSDESMENFDVGAAMPVSGTLPEGNGVRLEQLPGGEAACVVHHGPFATLSGAYNAVIEWINSNGYHISGPGREVYLQYERGGDQSKYVTEIQFPVEKG